MMSVARNAVFALALLALPFVAGCGGAVDTTSSSGSSGDPTPTPTPYEPPITSVPSPPVPPSPPTPAYPPPSKIAAPPGQGDVPFHLVVSNRSTYGMIGVDVTIDGTHVVTGGFDPKAAYTFDFALASGPHKLAIKTADAPGAMAAQDKQVFELSTDERWGVVAISTVHCDPCSPAVIRWTLQDTPPVF